MRVTGWRQGLSCFRMSGRGRSQSPGGQTDASSAAASIGDAPPAFDEEQLPFEPRDVRDKIYCFRGGTGDKMFLEWQDAGPAGFRK
eukprot:SAG22_NODE_12175_length_453_cov_8.310734_1_plen_85_part_10